MLVESLTRLSKELSTSIPELLQMPWHLFSVMVSSLAKIHEEEKEQNEEEQKKYDGMFSSMKSSFEMPSMPSFNMPSFNVPNFHM